MAAFFPSQIVEYLDAKFPAAKRQSEVPPTEAFYLPRQYETPVAFILTMIEAIPSRLQTLRGTDLIEFMEAVESIRLAVSAWRTGDNHYKLEKIPGRGNWHPLAIVRTHLASMPDEAADPQTAELTFISDSDFREVLRRDITAVNSALDNGEWKAATVLAGSVVEALLLDAVKAQYSADPAVVTSATTALLTAGTLRPQPPSDLDEWDLHQLTEVALQLRIISSSTAQQCRIARGFRNLVHPGRQIRMAQPCDRGTALSAVAAVEHVVRDRSS